MPFAMPFWQSLVQRSPQRFVVTLLLSMPDSIFTSSSMRGVTMPCTSPTRNTVCLSPPFGTMRRMRPGSYSSTEITEAIVPTVFPHPTILAIFSSFMQFCSETTKPVGAR